MRGTKTLARPKAARKNAPPFCCVFTLRAAVLFELRLPFPLPHLRGAFFFFCLVFLCLGIVVAKLCLAFKLREGALLKCTDLVRVKTDPHKISQNRRAYAEQFTGEYFKIVRINRTMAVPMYYLRSINNNDMIEGAFYGEELQRQRGNVWKIERVLARRTRRGVAEVKVKWKNFSDDHNSWIPERDIVQRF
jgi:hypothetical protein